MKAGSISKVAKTTISNLLLSSLFRHCYPSKYRREGSTLQMLRMIGNHDCCAKWRFSQSDSVSEGEASGLSIRKNTIEGRFSLSNFFPFSSSSLDR